MAWRSTRTRRKILISTQVLTVDDRPHHVLHLPITFVGSVEGVRFEKRFRHVDRVLVVRDHLMNKSDDGVAIRQYRFHVVLHMTIQSVHALPK